MLFDLVWILLDHSARALIESNRLEGLTCLGMADASWRRVDSGSRRMALGATVQRFSNGRRLWRRVTRVDPLVVTPS
ncbi:hypothetical protein CLOM_g4208 [Closterium sp. NIES-68]|nr:hypothetical protein CLOM_g7312 [Closterium sp. NIES-68]GJP44792.1 hypothetical protein CLOM_g4208 [Closterium sp. NIES-68]